MLVELKKCINAIVGKVYRFRNRRNVFDLADQRRVGKWWRKRGLPMLLQVDDSSSVRRNSRKGYITAVLLYVYKGRRARISTLMNLSCRTYLNSPSHEQNKATVRFEFDSNTRLSMFEGIVWSCSMWRRTRTNGIGSQKCSVLFYLFG
jgi:hypothetical protein